MNPETPNPTQAIMTRDQVAEYLKCNRADIGRLENLGLKSFTLSDAAVSAKAKKRYRKCDVDSFIAKRVDEQNAPVVVHPRALEIAQGLMRAS